MQGGTGGSDQDAGDAGEKEWAEGREEDTETGSSEGVGGNRKDRDTEGEEDTVEEGEA